MLDPGGLIPSTPARLADGLGPKRLPYTGFPAFRPLFMGPPLQIIGLGDLAECTIIFSDSGVNRQKIFHFHAMLPNGVFLRRSPESISRQLCARLLFAAQIRRKIVTIALDRTNSCQIIRPFFSAHRLQTLSDGHCRPNDDAWQGTCSMPKVTRCIRGGKMIPDGTTG